MKISVNRAATSSLGPAYLRAVVAFRLAGE